MFPSIVVTLLTEVVVVGVLLPPTMLVQRPVHYSVNVSLFMYEDALCVSQAKLYYVHYDMIRSLLYCLTHNNK